MQHKFIKLFHNVCEFACVSNIDFKFNVINYVINYYYMMLSDWSMNGLEILNSVQTATKSIISYLFEFNTPFCYLPQVN